MLYLITNRHLVRNGSLLNTVEAAIKGGIDAVILREKDLRYKDLMTIALPLKELVKKTKVKLIVNGSLRAAVDIQSDGYHTGFSDFMKNGPQFDGLLGVSVHSIDEALAAQRLGASYVLAGHVFQTDCKKGLEPRGLAFIKSIREKVDIPVIAIGGIDEYNIKSVMQAGADGAAVMSGIMAAENPKEAALKLKGAFSKSL